MKGFLFLTDLIIPMVIFCILCCGCLMGVKVYDSFIKGAKKGFFTVVEIVPTIVGLMVAVGALRASGFLEWIGNVIGRWSRYIGLPGELVPLSLIKMFSASSATGLLIDIYKEHGTDTFLGLAASISMSSTETIFYTMSVYFMAVGITKTRYTLKGALFATVTGIAASIIIAKMMTGVRV